MPLFLGSRPFLCLPISVFTSASIFMPVSLTLTLPLPPSLVRTHVTALSPPRWSRTACPSRGPCRSHIRKVLCRTRSHSHRKLAPACLCSARRDRCGQRVPRILTCVAAGLPDAMSISVPRSPLMLKCTQVLCAEDGNVDWHSHCRRPSVGSANN